MAVELRKGAPKVNLKKSSAPGEILINLNWSRTGKAIDLDLGCLYELTNGKKGCIQALGKSFGSLTNAPYISLDGDDRTGDVAGGENLRVNSEKIPEIKRILVYTFIYEGAVDWNEAKGVVTVKCPGNPEIIVYMDEYDNSQRMCAIAMFENYQNQTFSVERLVKFFDGQEMMDKYFNWGLRWVPGKKD